VRQAVIMKLVKFYQIFPVFPMENTFHLGCSTKMFTGTHLSLKQAGELVQRSVAFVYIVNALLRLA
jgi:hypothetical protein